MSFKCKHCYRTINKVSDILNCSRCQSSNRAESIPVRHDDTDYLTPMIIGYALGGGFSSSEESSMPEFSGGGGNFGGGGASGSWSSDSSNSSDSSSSSDSGGSSSGGGD